MKAKTDTKKSLGEDKTSLTDLAKNCVIKNAEWSVCENLRAEEQLPLADTIDILNSDDALELFKQTLPTLALLQEKAMRSKARKLFRVTLVPASTPFLWHLRALR